MKSHTAFLSEFPESPVCFDSVMVYPRSVRLAGIVGSSRVDLQACKLEYSIVSPK